VDGVKRPALTLWLPLTCIASLAIASTVLSALSEAEVAFWFGSRKITLIEPRALVMLGLLPWVVWPVSWSLASLSPLRLTLSCILRMLGIAAVAVALARPITRSDATVVSNVFVVDVSDSMSEQALGAAGARIDAALRAKGNNDVQLVTFAKTARVVSLTPEKKTHLKRHDDGSASNISGALSLALALFPPDHLRQVVLISDGLETHGDALAAAPWLNANQTTILTALPEASLPPEVAIADIVIPAGLKVGEPFRLRVRVQSTVESRATLRILQNGIPNGLESTRELTLVAGQNDVELRSVAYVAGPVTYRVDLTPTGGARADRFAQNNHFERSVEVRGKPRVLYVEGTREQSGPFAELLRGAGFEVDVRGAEGAPKEPSDLQGVDFYVLSNVHADALSLRAMDSIERFIENGGGFLMAGGDESFGLGGYRNTRLEGLLPVRLDTERRRDQPTLALSLVIDKSGSMSGQKIELAKEAARATADLLGPDDYLGVIGFDAAPTRVVRLQTASNRLGLMKGIGKLASGGGTAIFPALDAAYQDLAAVRARLKHVILLTDGQTQEEGIPALVQSMHVDGITVSLIGLGEDTNRALIEETARLGGGRAYFTNDPHNIPRLFMRETNAVAKSSAVEDYVSAKVTAQADFLKGIAIDSAPYLRGYVATRARSAPAQIVLESDLGEPLLARMRVGLGWSIAWTSDVSPRWSADWFRWKSFGAFWGQLIREHMPKRDDHVMQIETERQGDTLIASLDALDDDERFVHELTGELTLRAQSENDPVEQRAPLREAAPGRYEARFDLTTYGSFVLRGNLVRDGRPVLSGAGSYSQPFPAEYASLTPDEDLMARLAASTPLGGRAPRAEALFAPRGRRVDAQTERWSIALWLATIAFLLDLATRRLRFEKRPKRPTNQA